MSHHEALLKSSRDGTLSRAALFFECRTDSGLSNVTITDSQGNTCLILAAAHGHGNTVTLLLEKGSRVEAKNVDGNTSLIMAAGGGFYDVVVTLLEAGAITGVQNKDGWSAMMVAAANGHAAVVKLLIAKGADMGLGNNHGSTPLMVASRNNRIEVVKLLIDSGADKNVRNKDGWTCLMSAVTSGRTAIAKLLVDAGADHTINNSDGRSCLMVAGANGHTEVINFLLKLGANTRARDLEGWTALLLAAAHGHIGAVDALISGGCDCNVANLDGVTALMLAANDGNRELAKMLIERGASFASTDKKGRTALDYAKAQNQKPVVALLEQVAERQRQANDLALKQVQAQIALAVQEAEKRTREEMIVQFKGEQENKVKRRAEAQALALSILQGLYNATNGPQWTRQRGWVANSNYVLSLKEMEGVTMDDGLVTALDFSYNNLTGKLPKELGDIDSLTELNLAGNHLSGPIPASLGKLKNLKKLLIHSNNFEGDVPAELGHFSQQSLLCQMTGVCNTVNSVLSHRGGGRVGIPPDAVTLASMLKTFVASGKDDPLLARQLEVDGQLGGPMELCRSAAEELTVEQQRLKDMETSTITVRDEQRKKLVQRLQDFLRQVAALECHGNKGRATVSSHAEEIREATKKWLASLPNGCDPETSTAVTSPTTVRERCVVVLEKLEGWKKHQSPDKVTCATDHALMNLWKQLGASQGFLALDPPVLLAADSALEEERTFHTQNPLATLPLDELLATGALVGSCYAAASDRASALENGVKWAESELSRHQTVLSAPYPPGREVLRKLTASLIDLNGRIADLKRSVDTQEQQIRHMADYDSDSEAVESLQNTLANKKKELAELRDEKRAKGLSRQIMSERSRLYALAMEHFPELLVPGSKWSRGVGVDEDSISGVAVQRGLLAEGRELEDFTVMEVVSAHGDGKHVYRAEDGEGSVWALKVFNLCDERHLRQFYRHIKQMDLLRHPHLASISAVFAVPGSVYMQMPWYASGDLSQWLDNNPPTCRSLSLCKQILFDILLGLTHLHANGHVHCDIKPGNVFLTSGMRAVLGDFDGLLDITSDSAPPSMQSPMTEGYTAPEVKSGSRGAFADKSDLYSVGVVASQMFEGVPMDDEQTKLRDNLISILLAPDPTIRPTARDACLHPFLVESNTSEDLLHCQCCVCFDVKLLATGIVCTGGSKGQVSHFTCNDCFDGYIGMKATLERRQWLAEERGHIPCPVQGCIADPFSPQDVANHTTKSTYSTYMQVLEQGTEEKLVPSLHKEFNDRLHKLQGELVGALAVNDIEEASQLSVSHVLENILTLKCPRCFTAILDFSGCFALECAHCSAALCGWCLSDCGSDAHHHVTVCPLNRSGDGGFDAPFAMFEAAQNARRKGLLAAYLTELEPGLRTVVLKYIDPHLRRLGIEAPERE